MYTDIDITAKYGDQLLSIIEKMTNSKVNVIVDKEEGIMVSKDDYVKICKETDDSKTSS